MLSVPEGGGSDSWRKEAIRRWGALAGAGKEDRDWKLFVESRLSTPPPVSPIDFLQEYYVACGVVKGAFGLDARRRVDRVSGANPGLTAGLRTGCRLVATPGFVHFDEPRLVVEDEA